jgi:hypothetical protein
LAGHELSLLEHNGRVLDATPGADGNGIFMMVQRCHRMTVRVYGIEKQAELVCSDRVFAYQEGGNGNGNWGFVPVVVLVTPVCDGGASDE